MVTLCFITLAKAKSNFRGLLYHSTDAQINPGRWTKGKEEPYKGVIREFEDLSLISGSPVDNFCEQGTPFPSSLSLSIPFCNFCSLVYKLLGLSTLR